MALRRRDNITVVILAGGYATRLYPVTLDMSKPLLPIDTRCIIDFAMEQLQRIKAVEQIYVVTNHKFYHDYRAWQRKRKFSKKVTIVNDGTKSDKTKLGSIGDMYFMLRKKKIANDLLVIGGDNIFENYLANFTRHAQSVAPAVSIGVYDIGSKQEAHRYGVVALQRDRRIRDFQEKPRHPASSLIAMCVYFFPKETLALFHQYVDCEKRDTDKAGFYIKWLLSRTPVFGFELKGMWLDIGQMNTYKEAQRYFSKKTKRKKKRNH